MPGFLLPLGGGPMEVLVAVREPESGPPPFEGLEGWLGAGETAEAVQRRLEGLGFAVKRLTVREPQ